MTVNMSSFRQYGWASQASIVFTDIPHATTTITIGSVVYEFSAAGAVTVPTNIPVLIGLTLTATLDNLVAAVATYDTNNLTAQNIGGTEILFYKTSSPGSGIQDRSTSGSLAITRTATHGTARCGNFNETGASSSQLVMGSVTASALNVVGGYHLKMPFTINGLIWLAYDATGALLESTTATASFSGDTIVVDFSPAASPLVATDVFKFIVW